MLSMRWILLPMSLLGNSRIQKISGTFPALGGKNQTNKNNRYGDYQKEPEEPTVGSSVYPAKIYNSWDPNWRGFIGTAFIVGLEEFGHLITPNVTTLLLESLYNATKGDEYRVGGVDSDNLYPAYTNPVSRSLASDKSFAKRFTVYHARFHSWMDRPSPQ